MGRQRRDWTWWFVGLLLFVHALGAAGAAWSMSVTHDEYWHLPAGVAAWKSGRFDVDQLNPPLTRMWCAIPLLAESFEIDWNLLPQDAAKLGDAWLQAFHGDTSRYHALFFRARLMNVLLSVATGLLLAIWARDWFGNGAACIVALLWSCCPTAIANAALVTPDTGATLLFAGTLYAAWRYAKQPAPFRGIVLGALLGLAQLAKFTNVLLVPLVVFVWWFVRFRDGQRVLLSWKRSAGYCIALAGFCLLIWNLGYLFEGTGARLHRFNFQSRALRGLAGSLSSLSWCPVPLPRDYLEGLDHQRLIMEGEHPVFLDLAWRTTGFRSYFLKALAYKLPHATQGLIVLAAIAAGLSAVNRRLLRENLTLILTAALLIGVASFLRMQLGIRYILPALPLLYLFASQVAQWRDWRENRWRTAVVGIACALLPLSLRYHPHHLAYFNEYAGGPIDGRYHLLDSNLDWGQDLRELKSYLDRNRMGGIGLAYFGMVPPEFEGITYELPPAHTPLPGWYAVSVNFVLGRPHTLRKPGGEWRPVGIGEYSYFSQLEPVDRVGYSMDIYHVRPPDGTRP